MTTKIVKTLTIASLMALFLISPALSETFEGTIEGADCIINGTNCAKSSKDPHLCMVRNFVLVTADGEYYFLPNLHRSLKMHCYKQNVIIDGRRNGKTIRVNTLDLEGANGYQCIWDWEKIKADLENG
ncbi:hypothetical protein DSCO28_60120 [Desulfosarcina ovata subsp. sediminis]|uniref:Lipoprotein n=1 Tax=Desulfosarcina ovata subsp. sediminis TaxID=885957 RepID=A0A5K7ZZ54_9BACT|nr:hypothetical protein [Desulfosarcina ovata]BBO85446.1 hypothetical protein DSCO28_60120 [Desulfosarcina ovata subsp. sediminis]